MSYIRETLLSDEGIIYRTYRHWIIFWPVGLWLLISIAIALIVPSGLLLDIFGFETLFGYFSVADLLALAAFFIALISGLTSYLNYITSEFAVTEKRVLMKVGVVRRSSLEIFIEQVESINVRQSITGRLLGFGTVQVIGTGGTHDYFRFIKEPLTFRHMVHRQLYDSKG